MQIQRIDTISFSRPVIDSLSPSVCFSPYFASETATFQGCHQTDRKQFFVSKQSLRAFFFF